MNKIIKTIIKKTFTDFEDHEFRVKYFFTLVSYFIISLIIAQLLFPGGYSITKYYISDQGSTTQNPIGCWFFISAAIILGILMIPHLLYFNQLLIKPWRFLTYLMTLSGIIGCLGFIVVGAVPNSFPALESIHDWGANLAFGGFGFAAFFSFLINILKLVKKNTPPTVTQFLILYGAVISVGLGLIFFKSTVQQWFGLLTLLIWLIGTTLVMSYPKFKF